MFTPSINANLSEKTVWDKTCDGCQQAGKFLIRGGKFVKVKILDPVIHAIKWVVDKIISLFKAEKPDPNKPQQETKTPTVKKSVEGLAVTAATTTLVVKSLKNDKTPQKQQKTVQRRNPRLSQWPPKPNNTQSKPAAKPLNVSKKAVSQKRDKLSHLFGGNIPVPGQKKQVRAETGAVIKKSSSLSSVPGEKRIKLTHLTKSRPSLLNRRPSKRKSRQKNNVADQ